MSGQGTPLGEARCWEILEVGPETTREELRHAYLALKGLYSAGSGMDLPAMDEFDPAVQAGIMADIEAAYLELCGLQDPPPPPPAPPPVAPPPGQILDGPALRRIREGAGITLDHLVAETSIRPNYLEALEEERFQDLPSAPVIVRGYLTAYLAVLGFASEASVVDYGLRFQRWRGKG